jgi:hypothetical protein
MTPYSSAHPLSTLTTSDAERIREFQGRLQGAHFDDQTGTARAALDRQEAVATVVRDLLRAYATNLPASAIAPVHAAWRRYADQSAMQDVQGALGASVAHTGARLGMGPGELEGLLAPQIAQITQRSEPMPIRGVPALDAADGASELADLQDLAHAVRHDARGRSYQAANPQLALMSPTEFPETLGRFDAGFKEAVQRAADAGLPLDAAIAHVMTDHQPGRRGMGMLDRLTSAQQDREAYDALTSESAQKGQAGEGARRMAEAVLAVQHGADHTVVMGELRRSGHLVSASGGPDLDAIAVFEHAARQARHEYARRPLDGSGKPRDEVRRELLIESDDQALLEQSSRQGMPIPPRASAPGLPRAASVPPGNVEPRVAPPVTPAGRRTGR